MNTPPTMPAAVGVGSKELLAAESILARLSDELAAEYQNGGSKWPREWMAKSVSDRAALLKVRGVLIERSEAINKEIEQCQKHP